MTTQTLDAQSIAPPSNRRFSRRYFLNIFNFLSGVYLVALAAILILRVLVGDGIWWLALINTFIMWAFAPLVILIPLFALLRQRMMLLRTLPFVLIAVVWFVPYFLPKAVAASESDGPVVSVMSFNLLMNNPTLDRAYDWLYEQDIDVAVLQEVRPDFRTDPRYDTRMNERLSRDYFWESAIISKYPVTSYSEFDLNASPQERVVIDLDGHPVAVYSIHLSVPVGASRFDVPGFSKHTNMFFDYNPAGRNQQIRQLIDVLADETLPFIVIGDFNMSDQSMIYYDLAAIMHDSWREVGVGFGTTYPARPIGGRIIVPPIIRIDYVWHSDHFTAIDAAQGPYLGSDHLPLLVTLVLDNPPGS